VAVAIEKRQQDMKVAGMQRQLLGDGAIGRVRGHRFISPRKFVIFV
jgi:hypothetical protein